MFNIYPLEKVFVAMYFGWTIFAADKIFIGLFSCFRLRQKESQMEIVSDHLCHFQSKSLSAFRRNVRNQIYFSGRIYLDGTYPTPLVFSCHGSSIPTLGRHSLTAALEFGPKESLLRLEIFQYLIRVMSRPNT